ncbi:CIR protein PIR protein [Plasmodium vinckei lentum]|uniref:CIR protein PIR protein n=1 Tax=Plasmodium vinckei lentum TaxID=138297 RepID=A0A6V7S897_PLAVN|nr:CIR protein PIR protein [Plasmodium vinckei lentum]
MDHKQLCEKFLDADTFYDGKNGNITLKEIKKKQGFEEYCRNQACDTRKKIIGALSAYLFMKTRGGIYSQYDEFFLMWLSDKLFEIVKDEDKAQSKYITLNEAYDKYLKNNIQNGSYWSFLDSKKGLKEANIRHMKDFYKLLNHICKTIVYYKPNDDGIKNLIINSTNCSNQYLSLYNSVPKCSSYHHLLDNLKDIYDEFRNHVHKEIKKKKPQLAGHIQTLTTPDGIEMKLAINFKTFDFSNQKCKSKTKKKSTKSKETNPPSPQSLPVSSSQDNTKLKEPQESGKTNQNGHDDPKTEKNALDSKNLNADGGGGEKEDSNRGKGSESTNKGDSGDRSVGVQGDQGKSSDRTGGAGGILDGGPSDQGSKSGESGSGTGGGKDSGGNGGSNDGPKEPGDQDVTDPLGKSNGGWLGNWEINFNPMSYIPSVSDIYESSKNILISATDKISDTYTNTAGIVKDAYDSTVDNVKNAYNNTMASITDAYNNAMTSITDAYDRTTNYIGNAVNSVTIQLNPFSTSQSDDNQSRSNSLGGGVDTSNHSQPNPPLPPPPSPPLSVTPPSTPQSTPQPTSQPTTQPTPQPTSQPTTQPQDPPQTPSSSQQHSNQTQDKLQITVQNGTSNTLQQPDPNTGKGAQTMTITKATLSSSSTDPSITGSGITTGIVVKMSEKSSIWCIGSNKKCDVLSIGIISISIFAFLTIMYKYISFGSAKNSKKKKSMRRVIKYGDGTRKTQIIIKSYDRNKHLKPIINSVDRKKDPTLNIYKLMQADPVPFINSFFLLIFFVYKKKLNYLEL